ncbi:hypothetical protein D4764_11G0001160, partial [Takifugu flavidus]
VRSLRRRTARKGQMVKSAGVTLPPADWDCVSLKPIGLCLPLELCAGPLPAEEPCTCHGCIPTLTLEITLPLLLSANSL